MDDHERRILAARAALRERFLARPQDAGDLGSGPPNRHRMPRLPPGQTESKKWPVLDLGRHPSIPLHKWRLQIDGAVQEPQALGWPELLALPQLEDESDFHCVTSWSKMDLRWKGVQLSILLALARPLPDASAVMLHSYDGYCTNLSLHEALKDDVLLAHTVDGAPLPIEHGGPARVITPQLYAWKGAKWISRLELMTVNRPGFWEERGYSNSALPWRNDRYG